MGRDQFFGLYNSSLMTLKPQICSLFVPPVCGCMLSTRLLHLLTKDCSFSSTGTVVITVDFLMKYTVGEVLLCTCIMLRNTVMVDLSISKRCCLWLLLWIQLLTIQNAYWLWARLLQMFYLQVSHLAFVFNFMQLFCQMLGTLNIKLNFSL